MTPDIDRWLDSQIAPITDLKVTPIFSYYTEAMRVRRRRSPMRPNKRHV